MDWFLEWKQKTLKHHKITTSPASCTPPGSHSWLREQVWKPEQKRLEVRISIRTNYGRNRWYSHPSTVNIHQRSTMVNPSRAMPRSFRLHCVGASSLRVLDPTSMSNSMECSMQRRTRGYRWFKCSDCIFPPDSLDCPWYIDSIHEIDARFYHAHSDKYVYVSLRIQLYTTVYN